VYFVTEFCLILVCIFITVKDTNLVLKYPVFIKTLKTLKKNVFLFSCIRPSFLKEKITSYFHTIKKTSKKNVLALHFGFNNQFIKVTRT